MTLEQKRPLKSRSPLKAKTNLKAKKHTINWWKKEADKWHSKATRYRFAEFKNGEWVAECITCHIEKPIKQLQCGHFMSRQHNFLRYSEENTAPQCYGCNVMQQGKQFAFGIEVDKLYGDGTAKRLHAESKISHQFKRDELLELISTRQQEVKFYEEQT